MSTGFDIHSKPKDTEKASPVGDAAPLLLRPDWVFSVACEVDLFIQSLMGEAPRTISIGGFFDSLPAPERQMERQLLRELRERIANLPRERDTTRAERARQLIVQDYQKPWTLADVAREIGCNRTTLQEEFRSLTRTSFHKFLVRHRVSIAQQLLATSDLKASCIAREVGYKSNSAFARHFKSITGFTLTTYRLRHGGSPAYREQIPAERARTAY
jgi:AraC-like DNA-binding protein